MRYFIMESHDIRKNLATEEYLMQTANIDEPLLLLYIQKPCVIIGRNQNAYEEIDLDYLRAHHIIITRRTSGGGAVYDDLGNLSFSFVMKKNDAAFGDYESVVSPILKVLHQMGAQQATLGGRNDLYLDGKKFSGNAMYTKKGRTYSHGTLMYDVDLSVLDQILTVSKEKIASKATPSVRKNVANLKPYLAPEYQTSTEEFRDNLLRVLYNVKDLTAIKEKRLALTKKDHAAIDRLFHERYANPDWIYGEAPRFQLHNRTRLPQVGIVDLHLNVAHGKITNLRLLGDFFGQQDVSGLAAALIGAPYEYTALENVLKNLKISDFILNLSNQEFLDLLMRGS